MIIIISVTKGLKRNQIVGLLHREEPVEERRAIDCYPARQLHALGILVFGVCYLPSVELEDIFSATSLTLQNNMVFAHWNTHCVSV